MTAPDLPSVGLEFTERDLVALRDIEALLEVGESLVVEGTDTETARERVGNCRALVARLIAAAELLKSGCSA